MSQGNAESPLEITMTFYQHNNIGRNKESHLFLYKLLIHLHLVTALCSILTNILKILCKWFLYNFDNVLYVNVSEKIFTLDTTTVGFFVKFSCDVYYSAIHFLWAKILIYKSLSFGYIEARGGFDLHAQSHLLI